MEGSLEGGADGKVGGVEGIGRWGREGRIGIGDGVALSWELGSRGGMRAGIKIERGRGRKRGAEFGLETIRETWTH